MHGLISRILDKRKIDSVEELEPEERSQIRQWNIVLSGESVTIDTLREFCRSQISLIEDRADGVIPLTMIQQACIHVYKNLLKAIEAPEAERKSLELYLTQLINEV